MYRHGDETVVLTAEREGADINSRRSRRTSIFGWF